MTPAAFPALVMFDLDGTLLDSAPDFVATINILRAARGAVPITLAQLRPHVSRGASAMLEAGFADVDADIRAAMVPEFLEVYQGELGRHGQPFAGVEALLAALESAGSRWAIVTNKPEALAMQMLPLLGWDDRCAMLVGGDTLAVRKPDPLPLLHVARTFNMDPDDCVYVGDDARDISAARAARMRSVVALWGYRREDDDPVDWGGDVLVDSASVLLDPAAWPARP